MHHKPMFPDNRDKSLEAKIADLRFQARALRQTLQLLERGLDLLHAEIARTTP